MADARPPVSSRAPLTNRLDPFEMGAAAMEALVAFGGCAHSGSLHPDMLALVKARTLQLTAGNYGQAQCRCIVEQHPALASKIASLQDWYTSRAFAAREKVALMWAEDVVYATSRGVPDSAYADAAREFSAGELWAITLAVAATCTWSQLAQTFHMTEPMK